MPGPGQKNVTLRKDIWKLARKLAQGELDELESEGTPSVAGWITDMILRNARREGIYPREGEEVAIELGEEVNLRLSENVWNLAYKEAEKEDPENPNVAGWITKLILKETGKEEPS